MFRRDGTLSWLYTQASSLNSVVVGLGLLMYCSTDLTRLALFFFAILSVSSAVTGDDKHVINTSVQSNVDIIFASITWSM